MLSQPKKYECQFCGKTCETRRGGATPIFCDRKCRHESRRRRDDNPFVFTDKNGYVRTKFWSDSLQKYVHEFMHHRVWRLAGNNVPKGYVLHHVNENKSDNRIENLELMSRREHTGIHHRKTDLYPDGGDQKLYGKTYRERVGEEKFKEMHRKREAKRRAILKQKAGEIS
jgi:hypothetical protein